MVSLIKLNAKISMQRKLTERQYHVEDNSDVEHQDVRMYCNKSQFLVLSFCVLHSKRHSARRFSKHYHLCFDPRLGMDICEILRIPCSCVSLKSMLNKPCISGIPSDEQDRYKPVTK